MYARTKEEILGIFLETSPQLRSPYGLYGYPPIWLIGEANGYSLYARPAKTQAINSLLQIVEVDGIVYQHHNDEKWVGQSCSTSLGNFEINGAIFYG